MTEQRLYAKGLTPSTFMPDIFLLDPDNGYIISGKDAFLHIIWQEILWLCTLLFLFVMFTILFLHGADKWSKVHALNQSATVAQGKVIRHRQTVTGSMNQSILYYVTYQYTLPGTNTTYTKEEFVDRSIYDRFEDGTIVDIKYTESDPTQAILARDFAPLQVETSIIIETILGITGALVIVIYGIPVLKQCWGDEILRRKGHLLQGQVLHCHHIAPMEGKKVLPSEDESAIGEHFWIELAYRFKTPDGKEIRGVAKRQRNDLHHKALPQFGAPVAIWYLDAEHYRLL